MHNHVTNYRFIKLMSHVTCIRNVALFISHLNYTYVLMHSQKFKKAILNVSIIYFVTFPR